MNFYFVTSPFLTAAYIFDKVKNVALQKAKLFELFKNLWFLTKRRFFEEVQKA